MARVPLLHLGRLSLHDMRLRRLKRGTVVPERASNVAFVDCVASRRYRRVVFAVGNRSVLTVVLGTYLNGCLWIVIEALLWPLQPVLYAVNRMGLI